MIGTIGVVAMAIILGALGLWMDHANRKSMEPQDGEKDENDQARAGRSK